MAFEVGIGFAEGEQLLHGEGPGFCPRGVVDGGGVSLGEHEAVAGGVLGVLDVDAEHVEEEDGEDLRAGGAGGRVAALGGVGGGDGVDAKLVGHVLQVAVVLRVFGAAFAGYAHAGILRVVLVGWWC